MGRRKSGITFRFPMLSRPRASNSPGENVELIARASFYAESETLGRTAVKKGQWLNARPFRRKMDGFSCRKRVAYTDEEANQKFEIPTQTSKCVDREVCRTHKSKSCFGRRSARTSRTARDLGMAQLDYQMADLVESRSPPSAPSFAGHGG